MGAVVEGGCSFEVDPDSVYDFTNYKRFTGEVSSVSPRAKGLMTHLLFGNRAGFKCQEQRRDESRGCKEGRLSESPYPSDYQSSHVLLA